MSFHKFKGAVFFIRLVAICLLSLVLMNAYNSHRGGQQYSAKASGHTYAVLKNGSTCMCDNVLDHIANKRVTSHGCDQICAGEETAGEDKKCGGKNSVNAYFIKGKCVQPPFIKEHVVSRQRGCIQHNQAILPDQYVMSESSTDCLMICEHQHHPAAIYGAGKKCWCGEFGPTFGGTISRQEEFNSTDSLEIFRTLAEDKRCGNVRLLPAGEYNRTLLTSYPGSGNTWIRYMLEKATGFYTGSYYSDKEIGAMGYLGESLKPSENRTDPLKNHLFHGLSGHENIHSIILIIRNPYKSILSYANFRTRKKNRHVGHATDDEIKKELNAEILVKKITKHLTYHKNVLSSKKPKLVLYYEDIVADPISNVRKMVEFFPNPALHPKNLEDRLACLRLELEGFAKRKPRRYSFEIYPPFTREVINKNIGYLRKYLQITGVEKALPPYEKILHDQK